MVSDSAHLDVQVSHVVLHGLQPDVAAEAGRDHKDGRCCHAGWMEGQVAFLCSRQQRSESAILQNASLQALARQA